MMHTRESIYERKRRRRRRWKKKWIKIWLTVVYKTYGDAWCCTAVQRTNGMNDAKKEKKKRKKRDDERRHRHRL